MKNNTRRNKRVLLNTIYSLPFLFLLLPMLALSQDPFYINYDINEGLPSSETYFVYADSSGLIWIATDRGICTYDGYRFSTYTTNEGLSHNTNFRIFKDPKNRLWFSAWDGSLSVYEDGKFKPIPLHKDSVYGEFLGFAIHLFFDDQDNVFIAKNTGTSSKIPGVFFQLDANDHSVSRHSVYDFGDAIWRNEERGEIMIEIGGSYLFFDKRNHFSVNVVQLDSTSSSWITGFENHKAKYFDKNQLTSIHSSERPQINNFFLDPDHNLWLCTGTGLLMYEQANLKKAPRHFFKNMEITSMTIDREGNYWMTSRENGIFWIPSFQFYSLLRPKTILSDRRVTSIGKMLNFLLFGTVKNGVVAVDEQFNLSSQFTAWEEVEETKRMYTTNDTIYIRNFDSVKELNGELKTFFATKYLNNSQLVKKLNNGLYIASNNSLYGGYAIYTQSVIDSIYSLEERYLSKYINKWMLKSRFNVRINCFEEAEDILWLGGIDGLYRIRIEEIMDKLPHKDTSSIMNVRVEDIISVDSQKLWLATIGNGLVFKNGGQYFQLSEEDGMSSNLINTICLENDSTLWAGTNKGLNRVIFRMKGEQFEVRSIIKFSTSDGLVSNFVNDISIWREQLWLATNQGVNYIEPRAVVENKTPPLIWIEEVLVGEQAIKEEARLSLAYNENDLLFNFLGISFQKPKNNKFYRYRLTKDLEEGGWYYTDNRSIRFLDLTPGDYTFEVAAQNKNGYWSNKTANYTFVIKAHFFDQLWFRILAFLALISLLGAGFLFWIRTIQSRETQKRKLQDAELSVLRNQMNPHFIFNSLNSIQSFIFHKDVKQANYYLSKFSRLMRNSLEYSSLKNISVEEEINFIRSYLDLEKLRFDDSFEVHIKVAPEIPVHLYFIPSLLLQPVLENSVKHAFKKITYPGLLDIQFLSTPEDDMIQVIICDNGPGLSQKEEAPLAGKHRSMGLSITKNRIKLLNPNGEASKASFKFSNRYNAKKEVIGTQAHFLIPVQSQSLRSL